MKGNYVDGFLLVVKKDRLAEYKKIATFAAKTWMKYGALQYVETYGDDMTPEWCMVPFTKVAKTKEDELVVFSWITYKSKSHRDAVNKKVMNDEQMAKVCDPKNSPFDIKRTSYGGFKVLVQNK
jgi:alkaline phosphatase